MSTCGFDESWVGRCKEPSGATERCSKHADLKCTSCGAPAVRSCDHTGGFVCGAPLCGDCRHSPPVKDSLNLFGMGGDHKPSEIAIEEWRKHWAAEGSLL